ncbi:uncharacterized protein [Nicotiana sylvestris]|uniref:uncharacterized protein n=1 Tax=Nicotiana sylvestris TaxID=4096 RepID=UPI00388C400A
MKIFNEAHVPDKITVNHLEKIAGKIFEANRITFSDDELPMEGTEHNRALYLTVKCEDSVVSRVLVDNGSSANIFPLSTLQKLNIGTKRIHLNSVCVRGFDRGGKDSVGDIMLELSIGPVEFTMEFQVLDVAVSYNLLLGRPWIHVAKAVPSLHQMVKFEWDTQEIVVHGDEDLSACNDKIVPFIEAEDNKGPWVYQTFETVSVEKFSEGKCIPGPKLSFTSVMVVNEILKNGFVSGKGLGSSLQGIVHLVRPSGNLGTFGLGFMLTEKDVKRVKNLKQKVWSLPNPIPHISMSFVKPGAEKPPTSSIPKPVVDVDEELIKSSFYAGCSDMTCMKSFQPSLKNQYNSEITIQEVEYDDEIKYDEEAAFEEISKELKQFEEKPKPNLSGTEAINLGDQDDVREKKISVHLDPQVKEAIIKTLFEYKDVFAWSYDDMPGLSTDLSKKQSDHVKDLRKFFQRLHGYNLKLNPAKCAFGVPSGKLLGFVVSRCGIELDPSKIKSIQELPPPKNKTELLKKNVAVKWTDECQEAFDKIKRYLSNPPVLVPPELGRPLILYLTVLDNSFGCPIPTGRLAKWQILLTEFDIIYVTRTAMKAQALAGHLAENLVDDEYKPLKTYFPDEEIMCVDEVDRDEKPGLKLFFDGAANMKSVGVGAVLISETGQHYPIQGEWETRDLKLILYRQCLHDLSQRFRSVEVRHIPRIHNEIDDVLATLVSMLHHPDKAYVDPVHIQVRYQHAYCNVVEEEIDSEPWFHDFKEYIRSGVYPVHVTGDQKRTIRRLASGFFLSGGILYKRTPDLGLLRCIDAKEASTIMSEVHSGVCGPHMNGFILVAIDYFTKWVEAVTFKSVTKKVVVDFVHSNIICRFGIPKVIVTDNAANLNSHLMKEVCQQFKIMHWNSTLYRPKANGAVEAANKNIKKILYIEDKCVDMAINSDAVKRGKKIFKSTGTSHGKAWFREQEILFRILKDESMTQDPPG